MKRGFLFLLAGIIVGCGGGGSAGDVATDTGVDAIVEDQIVNDDVATDAAGDTGVTELVVDETVEVTAYLDFDGDDPDTTPWSVLYLYRDRCYPDFGKFCSFGEEGQTVLIGTLTPGTYYFVVDGDSYWYGHWGPYSVLFAFTAPPSNETVCNDTLDEDGGGLTDCYDPDCIEDSACSGCPVSETLECGVPVYGQIQTPEEHTLNYRFTVDKTTNVALYWETTGDATGRFYVNFKEWEDLKVCDDLYSVGGVPIWHTSDSAGFTARPDEYLVRIDAQEYLFSTGAFRLTLYCDAKPEDECGDDQDNDFDSWVDYEDADGFLDPACSGGDTGEDCATAIEINGGAPISLQTVGTEGFVEARVFGNVGRANDLSASCSTASVAGPDVVFKFIIEDELFFAVVVENREFLEESVVYLMKDGCNSANLIGCGEHMLGFTHMNDTTLPGTYYVVVDSASIGLDGQPSASDFDIEFGLSAPGTPEDCHNDIDDNGNDLIDCMDRQCFADTTCTGGHSGEDCDDPFVVNGGASLEKDVYYVVANTTVDMANDLEVSCSPYSKEVADSVFSFALSAQAKVNVQIDCYDGGYATMALFTGSCALGDELSCVETGNEYVAEVEQTLSAGTYYVVVDAAVEMLGNLIEQDYLLTIVTTDP